MMPNRYRTKMVVKKGRAPEKLCRYRAIISLFLNEMKTIHTPELTLRDRYDSQINRNKQTLGIVGEKHAQKGGWPTCSLSVNTGMTGPSTIINRSSIHNRAGWFAVGYPE